MGDALVGGLHGVRAVLLAHAGAVRSLLHLEGRRDARLGELLALASERGVAVEAVRRDTLDRLAADAGLASHQGVLLRLAHEVGGPRRDGLLSAVERGIADGQVPLVLVLDGVQDPHNLGACLRSAEAAGVTAVVTPRDNAAGLGPTVRKVAAGAVETVRWFEVANLARALDGLKALGCWVYGAAGEGDGTLYALDLAAPAVLVLGAEGRGLRRLTRERCDALFRIPMAGTVGSLNVSVATGIALFEARRQRLG